jgi:hypothetical protein
VSGWRRVWTLGTILGSLGSFVLAVGLAPGAGAEADRSLQWLLFVGSSVHVASTAWFFTVPAVRAHALRHRGRYVLVPLLLVAVTAATAAALSPHGFRWLLLGFFGWQFFHFQKQNLGLAALAGVSHRAGSLRRPERLALMAAGWAGTVGLLAHPSLLQLDLGGRLDVVFGAARVVYGAAVLTGAVVLARRPAARRPASLVFVYLTGLLFFVPVFCFSSPYAAVAGLTLAHGYQYLLIMGLVAGAPRTAAASGMSLAVLLNVALLGGLALSAASHLHDAAPLGRGLYGAYLGVVMAHFVLDGGLWRLREEFPRELLGERLPYLLRTTT